jgi:hypothetical protein
MCVSLVYVVCVTMRSANTYTKNFFPLEIGTDTNSKFLHKGKETKYYTDRTINRLLRQRFVFKIENLSFFFHVSSILRNIAICVLSQ